MLLSLFKLKGPAGCTVKRVIILDNDIDILVPIYMVHYVCTKCSVHCIIWEYAIT